MALAKGERPVQARLTRHASRTPHRAAATGISATAKISLSLTA